MHDITTNQRPEIQVFIYIFAIKSSRIAIAINVVVRAKNFVAVLFITNLSKLTKTFGLITAVSASVFLFTC